MNKIKLIILFAVFFVSCEDQLDIEPHGVLDPSTTFQTVEDLKLGLNANYKSMTNNAQIALSSIWTDEVGIGYANGGQGALTYAFDMTSGSSYPRQIWEANYAVVNFTTRLDVYAQNIEVSEEDMDEYKDILAQNRFMRAWANFELLTYFSEDLKDPNALGVIKLDFIPSISDELPRVVNQEMFDYIEEDLDYAEANLLDRENGIYVNKNTVKALRARMAIYRGDNSGALAYSQQLIDAVPLSNYSNYPSIWTDAVQGEVIFKLERRVGDGLVGANWFSIDHTYSGSPFFEIGRSLFNEISTNDVRYSVIVGSTSVIDPNYQTSTDYRNTDVLLINKYPGSESTNRLNDLKIYRATEMYFIKAEALINQGDLAGAAQVLQEVRTARFPVGQTPSLPVYSTQQEAYADLLAERRVEFAFEGFRYVDIGRLGEMAGVDIVRDSRDCETNGACSLSASSYKLTLPIPATETAINDAIAGQQNSGY